MREEFRDVKGYEGLYQVSNYGTVKSLDRDVFSKRHNRFKNYKGKVLAARLSGKYLLVGLCKNGIPKSFRVHQLVAIAFLGHTPCGHVLVVDHIDNNPLNNNLYNLQVLTNRENVIKNPRTYGTLQKL